jgi:hypothetical protein
MAQGEENEPEPVLDKQTITAEAGFGIMRKKPFVEVTFGPVKLHLSPKKTRSVATMLLQTAADADNDHALMGMLEATGMQLNDAARMLNTFRGIRHNSTSTPNTISRKEADLRNGSHEYHRSPHQRINCSFDRL